MSTPTPLEPAESSPARKGAIIAVIVLAVAALFAVAWWLSNQGDEPLSPTPTPSESATATPSPTPSVTPEPSPTVSPSPTQTASAASMTDVEGRWCPTSPAEWEERCFTIALPWATYEEGDVPTAAVYPPGADVSADPSTFDYSAAANNDECWQGAIDVWPPQSGAAFIFCPAGATSGEAWIDSGAYVNQDRVYVTQEETEYPYLRADDE